MNVYDQKAQNQAASMEAEEATNLRQRWPTWNDELHM